jgi:hypothetical protein
MTTTDDSMARYTESETATFTFIGRAESDTATDLVDKVEECLIGLNLEPQQGWAWIAEGRATAGNLWSCSAPASLTSSKPRSTSILRPGLRSRCDSRNPSRKSSPTSTRATS